MELDQLKAVFAEETALELAVLIGSRAAGSARTDSDWDIAIQWSRSLDFSQQLAATEKLRNAIAKSLGIMESSVDLIDLPTARLAMKAVIAEEGIPLKGAESLPWCHFLQRTWRELEEQYWEQTYAA